MNNSASHYEFQARDKFWRLVRGRIIAVSEADAKLKLKSKGLFWPQIWKQGTKPFWALATYGFNTQGFVSTLKERKQNNNDILYSAKLLPKLIFGSIFTVIGLGIILGYRPQMENIGDWLSLFIVFPISILFLLIGISILIYRFELFVNRQNSELTMRMSIIPGLWRCESIAGNSIKKVVCRRELVYPSETLQCYYVFVITEDREIHLDSSSSKKMELEMGQNIAEYLNVPFVNEIL
jgi:hypothetical protein